MNKDIKVAVGLSGGVDSSLTAKFLQKSYAVFGITLKLYDKYSSGVNEKSCGNAKAIGRAQKAANELGIPLHVIDCSEIFFNQTLKKCWDSFEKGCTPNPCHICNTNVKFQKLLETARKLGARKIATGHYARITFDSSNRPVLKRGIDSTKDQSYFLSGLSREILSHTLFPLGGMKKTEVRKIAKQHGLSSVEQKESQDLCFAGEEEHFSNTLCEKFKGKRIPGVFIDEKGTVLRKHNGIHQYTIGQRRGLGIATGRRVKITSVDPSSGVVIVSENKEAAHSNCCTATPFRWSLDPLHEGDSVSAQVRYRQKPSEAIITQTKEQYTSVQFIKPVFGVTPGQILVLYKDNCVVGCGTISR